MDLTKAFDLVSRDGLFKLLPKVGCPPIVLSLTKSFHSDMKGTVRFDGSTSVPFNIVSGVKQGCVLAPTLFGIFFSLMVKYAFGHASEGILLHTRSDGRLFNLARLKAKTEIRRVLIRDLLFADDDAVVAHSAQHLQALLDRFSLASKEFGLSISLKKTNFLCQGTPSPPSIFIDDTKLEVVHRFNYLGSTVTDNLSLDAELDIRLGKAATTLGRLTSRVWNNSKLTTKTKMAVYNACVISTLLYGSDSWPTYSRQEKRLDVFHLRSLRKILGIAWQDHVTNADVLSRAGLPSMYSFLRQCRLRWLGHIRRMGVGRIPKDILYGELAQGKRPIGRPHLRFKDVVKRDLVGMKIDIDSWEQLADDRAKWRATVHEHIMAFEARRHELAAETRRMHSERSAAQQDGTTVTNTYQCDLCGRQCLSRRAPQPQKTMLQQHHHLALFYFFLFFLFRLSTFYFCFYIL